VLALCLLALAVLARPLPAAAQLAPQPGVRPVHEVRTVHTSELGVESPRGVAYSPDGPALLVAGPPAAAGTPVERLSLFEDRLGALVLAGAPATLAFDGAGQRLVAVDGDELVTVAAGELPRARPPAQRIGLGAMDLEDAAGVTFEADGSLVVLDARARALVRLAGANPAGAVRRAPLTEVGDGPLLGLARNPADGLLYVGSPGDGRLYAVDDQGRTQATYDLASLGLADQQGFVFAPTADPTDDPARTSLYVADGGDSETTGSYVEASLAAPTALAATPEASVLVQTVDTSAWTPSSPDPSGVVYMPGRDKLAVSDSEVEEMSWLYQGVNLWETTTAQATVATDTGRTTAFSNEPTGLSYRPSDDALLVSDDNADRIFFVRPGADGRHGTADDEVTSFSTRPHSEDPEDVAYDTTSGDVFVIDGVGMEVYRVQAGPDGQFGTSDDAWSSFDVQQYGARDPEGIDHDPASDHLFVVDQRSRAVYRLTKTGELVGIVDIFPASSVAAAGVALAPGSVRPDRRNLWVVDRNVDNGPDPFENDGRMYELSFGPTDNNPPVVDAVVIDQAAPRTDDVLTVTISASDPDGDELTYTYRWRLGGVAIPGQVGPTLDLSLAGNGDRGDVISVRVTAVDGISESAPRTSSQVTIVNSPPVFGQDLADRTDPEDAAISLAAGATDADGDALAYEASGLPAGLAIDAASGLISGTIAAGAASGSPYGASVSVTDGSDAAEPDAFTWTVGASQAAAITFRGAASAAVRDTNKITLARPEGVAAGDILVVAIDVTGRPNFKQSSGWTTVRTTWNGTAMRQAVFSRVVTASEPSSYSWSFSRKASAAGVILGYRGVDTANPIDTHGAQVHAGSTAITAPSLTTTAATGLLVGFFGTRDGATISEPAGMAERAEARQTAGSTTISLAAADEALTASGETGARTATSSPGAANIGQAVALRPAP
jgi:hypothetical protein